MRNNLANIAFAAFIACLPLYVVRLNIMGLPTTLVEILFVLLVVIWIVTYRDMLKDGSLWRGTFQRARGFWIFGLLIFIAGIIATVIAPEPLPAFGLFRAYLAEPLLFAWLLVWHVEASGKMQYLLWALGLSSFAVSVYAWIQYLFQVQLTAPWNTTGMIRATSIYPYPNALGLYVAPVVALFAGLLWKRAVSGFREIGIATAIVIAGFGALIASRSDGAIAGVLAAIFLYSVTSRRWKIAIALWVSAIVIATTVSPFSDVALPIMTLTDVSGDVRRVLWLGTFHLLQDHWLLGAGLSGFPSAYDAYREARHVELLQYPHNILLNVWVELGLFGAVAFFGILGVSIKKNIDLVWSSTRALRSAGVVFLGAVVTIIVHGLVDVPFFKNDLAFQWWFVLLLPVLIVAALPRPTR